MTKNSDTKQPQNLVIKKPLAKKISRGFFVCTRLFKNQINAVSYLSLPEKFSLSELTQAPNLCITVLPLPSNSFISS